MTPSAPVVLGSIRRLPRRGANALRASGEPGEPESLRDLAAVAVVADNGPPIVDADRFRAFGGHGVVDRGKMPVEVDETVLMAAAVDVIADHLVPVVETDRDGSLRAERVVDGGEVAAFLDVAVFDPVRVVVIADDLAEIVYADGFSA